MIKLRYNKKNQKMKRNLARNCGKSVLSYISHGHILIRKVDKCRSLIHHSNVQHGQTCNHSLHHTTRRELKTTE